MPKILLVEDNDTNRDMLSRRLERKGYEVIIAVNGEESVAKTMSDRPDIVLMDLHLPVLDGWAATHQIKANPQTQNIPVIALTADAIAGEREKALAAGCDDYETKPIDLPRLLQKIDNLIAPPASPSPTRNSSPDRHSQQILLAHLRHQLDPPIDRIVGYSDLILATLSEQQQSDLAIDIQKIHLAGIQLLQIVQTLLSPVLLEIQHQEIEHLTLTLRREILTPLSTIIGYCELLLEEANLDIIPDLEQIQTAARDLLGIVNSLDRPLDPSVVAQMPTRLTTHYPIRQSRRYANATSRSSIVGESHILVLDDNVANSTLLAKHLERHGAKVSIASTDRADDALAIAPFDLILLDISLTGMSGLQLLEQLAGHQQWHQIPVLLLAAPDELDLVVQGIALGATDYVTKPLQSLLLHTKVAACLEQKRCQPQIAALQLEIANLKRTQQVGEIVQTDYFQQLQPDGVAPQQPDAHRALSPRKVLLVEDNELNCDMLLRRLERAGYEVVIANDGAEGVSTAEFELPDVILMDISLPVMDGWEATQLLKANPQTAGIPIIALTAHAMAGDREKALAAGCNDYDTKPVELPRLLGKIERCLQGSISKKVSEQGVEKLPR